MSNKLPQPNIEVPHYPGGVKAVLLKQSGDFRDSNHSTSWDKQRLARQALANCDLLLDHYPNGSPRDHIVAYTLQHSAIEVPANVIVGSE